ERFDVQFPVVEGHPVGAGRGHVGGGELPAFPVARGEYDDRRLRRVEPHAQTDVLAVPGEPGNRAHFTRPCVEFIRNRRVGEGGYRDVVVDEFKYVLLTVAHVDEVEEFFVPLDPADVFEVRVGVGHRWLDSEVGQREIGRASCRGEGRSRWRTGGEKK